MSQISVWKRQNGKVLTLTQIKEIVGYITYEHEAFNKSIHFILKLRIPKPSKTNYDYINYYVKPWDISSNTLKSTLFKSFFRKNNVSDWRQLIDRNNINDINDMDESNPSNPSPPNTSNVEIVENNSNHTQNTNNREPSNSALIVPASSSNHNQNELNLRAPPSKKRKIDQAQSKKDIISLSPLSPDPQCIKVENEHFPPNHNRNHNNLPSIQNLNRESIQNISSQQMVQKMESIHCKISGNLNAMNLSEMLRHCHLLNYLMNQCDTFQFELNEKLEKNHKASNKLSFEFNNLSNIIANFKKEIIKYDQKINVLHQEIKQLTESQNKFKYKVNNLNDKLIQNVQQNMGLKQNISQSKQTLITLQNQTQKNEQISKRLLNEIESIKITKWNEGDIVDWILSICHGYFLQTKYSKFIESVKNTKINHEMFQTQINELLLRAWGLTDNSDISMFMVNYQRLMSKQ